MRLLQKEINDIKSTFKDIFNNGKIYLFGSRIDDTKRGGDIDLFIELDHKISIDEMMKKRTQFKLKLYELIGEQKIDVVISKDKTRLIEKEALKNGIEL
jgi:predicted nucleotidyltransferase